VRPLTRRLVVPAVILTAALLYGSLTTGATHRQLPLRTADRITAAPAQAGSLPHQRDCFADPGACGYPDPTANNVGPSTRCARLRRSGPRVLSRPGQVLRNVYVQGKIWVRAADVTIDNVCVVADGYGQLGSQAIQIEGQADHTLIEHATILGADNGHHSVESDVENDSGRPATLEHVNLSYCGECVHGGPWTIRNSYIIANGMQGTSDHYEDVYCDDTSVRMYHDTALNPENQVAEVFCDTNNGSGGSCSDHVSIVDSLLAGGGFLMYACGNATSPGTSSLNVVDNVFARCRTQPVRQNRQTGGYACAGTFADTPGAGADKHGYWPRGGYYGVASDTFCPPDGGASVWTDNVWDDNHQAVRC
jgi:hypothetical protein